MIDLQTKIHDKFTLEFKVGFIAKKNQNILNVNDFVMNTWIFVPNSLDINKSKYPKENFYRDIKSGVRLITPSYKLHDLAIDELYEYADWPAEDFLFMTSEYSGQF